LGPQQRTHRRPQCQPPDAAHAVDAKLHDDISAMIDRSDGIVMIP
jgi:hypothetical protein